MAAADEVALRQGPPSSCSHPRVTCGEDRKMNGGGNTIAENLKWNTMRTCNMMLRLGMLKKLISTSGQAPTQGGSSHEITITSLEDSKKIL